MLRKETSKIADKEIMKRLWDPSLETLKNINLDNEIKKVLKFLHVNLSSKWEFYVKPSLDGLNPSIILLNDEIGIQVIDFEHQNMNPISRLENMKEEILKYYIPQSNLEKLSWQLIATCYADPLSDKSEIQKKFDNWVTSANLKSLPKESNYFSIISKEDLDNKDPKEAIKKAVPFSDFKRSKYMTTEIADSLRPHLRTSDFLLENIDPLKVNELSEEQQNLILTRTPTGYRRIRGSSGSGKTLVLAGKVADLYKQGKSVLFLCFNKTLVNLVRSYFHRFLKGDEELEFIKKRGREKFHEPEFLHYHRYAKRTFYESGKEYEWKNFFKSEHKDTNIDSDTNIMSDALHDLIKKISLIKKYDAVLIDEGQDFLPQWWRAVRQLLEDDGEAYFVIDEAQDLYENKEKWTDNAMKNSGFSGRPSLLKASYRLPQSYIPFIQNFMEIYKPKLNSDVDLLEPEQPSQAELKLGSSEKCHISWEQIFDTDLELARKKGVERCVELVSDVLPKIVDSFSYNDITLICSTHKSGLGIVEKLDKKGIKTAHIFGDSKTQDFLKMNFTLTKEKIKISTVHSFKGFESPLILYFMEKNIPFEEAYTALTRLRPSQKNNSHIKVVCIDPKYHKYGETWSPAEGREWLNLD